MCTVILIAHLQVNSFGRYATERVCIIYVLCAPSLDHAGCGSTDSVTFFSPLFLKRVFMDPFSGLE